MNHKKLILIAVALFALIGIIVVIAGLGRKPSAPAASPDAKRPPAAKVEDSIFLVDGEPVGMSDGYEIILEAPGSEAATVTRIFGLPVMADLDGDTDVDAAVMIVRASPGTGTFYYLAASIKEEWGYRGTTAVLLGDRIAPQTVEVKDAVIVANYADRKPGEPMTAMASVGVSKYFRIEGGELKEVAKP